MGFRDVTEMSVYITDDSMEFPQKFYKNENKLVNYYVDEHGVLFISIGSNTVGIFNAGTWKRVIISLE